VTDKRVVAGKIGAAHGIKGWLKIFSYTDPIDNLLDYQPWWIQSAATQDGWQKLKIVHSQVHGQALLVGFADIHDRDAAARLTNKEIYIEQKLLPKLAEGEYYWSQLEGLEVKNLQGFVFGRVTHLMETGANDVMFVKGEKEYCLPYLPGQVIKHIDLAKNEMIVDWPEEI